jgi:lipoate-protein ligase A
VSILYDFPIAMVERYLKLPKRQPEYRAGRPHEGFLMNLTLPRPALLIALRAAWHAADPMLHADLPGELVNELVATRFGDPKWVARL